MQDAMRAVFDVYPGERINTYIYIYIYIIRQQVHHTSGKGKEATRQVCEGSMRQMEGRKMKLSLHEGGREGTSKTYALARG